MTQNQQPEEDSQAAILSAWRSYQSPSWTSAGSFQMRSWSHDFTYVGPAANRRSEFWATLNLFLNLFLIVLLKTTNIDNFFQKTTLKTIKINLIVA
jgi:hypothetical protein